MIELPEKYCAAMQELLGEEYSEYMAAMEEESRAALRINTNKIDIKKWKQICPFSGIQQIPWTEKGWYYEQEEVQPAKHPYYFAGLYYIQEASAMIPAGILPAKPGDKVLDLCAAPGGKATEIAAKLQGKGLLVANDISVSRTMALTKNLQMAGTVNAVVTAEEPARLTEVFSEYFDGILIDAPCSGEGMFRRDPHMVQDWLQRGPSYYAEIQREILGQAYRMLRPGGYLVYSTCTFSAQENEEMIAAFLSEYRDMYVQAVKRYPGFSEGRPDLAGEYAEASLTQAVRIFPHKSNAEGHFAVLLQKLPSEQGETVLFSKQPSEQGGTVLFSKQLSKQGETDAVPVRDRKYPKQKKGSTGKQEDREVIRNWLCRTHLCDDTEIADILEYRLLCRKDQWILLPEGYPNLQGLRVMQSGLILGTVKKGRFTPSPQLALAIRDLSDLPVLSLPAKDLSVIKYLKGETIDAENILRQELLTETDSYLLVCVDGYPLGWAKASGDGRIKNKYYAGWRMQ